MIKRVCFYFYFFGFKFQNQHQSILCEEDLILINIQVKSRIRFIITKKKTFAYFMPNFLIIMQPYAEEPSPIKVYGSRGCVPNLIDTIFEFKREKMSWILHFSFPSPSFPPLSNFFPNNLEVTIKLQCALKDFGSRMCFLFF